MGVMKHSRLVDGCRGGLLICVVYVGTPERPWPITRGCQHPGQCHPDPPDPTVELAPVHHCMIQVSGLFLPLTASDGSPWWLWLVGRRGILWGVTGELALLWNVRVPNDVSHSPVWLVYCLGCCVVLGGLSLFNHNFTKVLATLLGRVVVLAAMSNMFLEMYCWP